MRILVTNDDGFNAPGLAVLARALAEAGHEVVVVAPLSEASGSGAGIGPLSAMGGGIHLEAVAPVGLAGIKAFAADALPALIVITACLGAFGPPPDLVASGINPGRNVGRAVLHSGTVGAALTSVHFGSKGLATSIQAGPIRSVYESSDGTHTHFESAAALAVAFAAHLERAPVRTVLNLNVPNLALGEIRGVRRARLATTGLILAAGTEDGAPRLRLDLGGRADLGARQPDESDESDEALTELGWAVVTPLASVTEDQRPEVGDMVEAAMGSASRCLETARGLGGAGPFKPRQIEERGQLAAITGTTLATDIPLPLVGIAESIDGSRCHLLHARRLHRRAEHDGCRRKITTGAASSWSVPVISLDDRWYL